MADEHTHTGTPAIDDPQITQAMAVYDTFNAEERREVFRAMFRAVTAFGRTGDIDHLTGFAESVSGMVRLESQDPGLREEIRRRSGKPLPADAHAGIPVAEAVKLLREG